ncbi:MAG TPA: FIST N-terminal domain-containing protein, partial [Candidatus Thermoplasmatota archaeon]|nr:FIST N-terminal domain-containing protein [Candidatus Thermoplasmatota archaeon]
MKEDITATIRVSRKTDIQSIAQDLLSEKSESSQQPKALFLFTTIHYKKEFTDILSMIKNEFSDVPLIGGTVSGFMSDEGCFTRGVVLLSLYGEKMEVTPAIGRNTKKNPKKAVEQVTESIGFQPLYDQNVLVEFASTAVIPHIPGIGQQNVILSKTVGNQLLKLVPLMNKMNYGYDRADEILDMLAETYSDRLIIGGCTMDDNKMLENYQFYDDQVNENSVVAFNLSFPNTVCFENILGFKPLQKRFQVTELSKDKHILKKIDGKPARTRLFDELNIELIEPQRTYQLFKKSFYYPLGYKKDDIWHSFVVGIVYGDNLIGGSQIKNDELQLLSLSVGSIFE